MGSVFDHGENPVRPMCDGGQTSNHSGFVALRAWMLSSIRSASGGGIVPPSIGMMPMSASSCISPMTNLKFTSTSPVSRRICAAIGRNQVPEGKPRGRHVANVGLGSPISLIDPVCSTTIGGWPDWPRFGRPTFDFSGGVSFDEDSENRSVDEGELRGV